MKFIIYKKRNKNLQLKICNYIFKQNNSSNQFASINQREKDIQPYQLKINDNINGFSLLDIKYFQDFEITAYYLKHDKAQSNYLHLDSSDKQNIFAIVLKSLAQNQKGLNQIFKNMLNSGSEKYPIKNSLKIINQYSLNQNYKPIQNDDHTTFSFNSQNYKDYQNLLDIYCDLIFKSKLDQVEFQKQAWRYEFEDKFQIESELLYKGKIIEEIKKANQDPSKQFENIIKEQIYSGSRHGESLQISTETIKKISYEQIREQFQQSFDFTNCYYYSYGNFNFINNLKYLNDRFLKDQECQKNNYNQQQSNLSENTLTFPKKVFQVTSFDDQSNYSLQNQYKYAISFLCNERHQDQILTISFIILDYIFFKCKDSPFYQNLIKEGFGSSYPANNGYDMRNKETSFTIGIQNIQKNQIKQVEKTIQKILKQLSKNGIQDIIILKALNRIEYDLKYDCQTFNQNLMHKVLGDFVNDDINFEFLNVKKNMDQVRKLIKEDKSYFQKIIKKYLIDNKNYIETVFEPDNLYNQLLKVNEKRDLQMIKNDMNYEQLQQILDYSKLISMKVIDDQNLSILPKLSLEDLTNDQYQSQIHITLIEGLNNIIQDIKVVTMTENAKGLTNIILKFDLEYIPDDLWEYFKMFQQFFPQIGIKNKTLEEFNNLKELYCQKFECKHEVIEQNIYQNSDNKIKDILLIETSCLDQFFDQQFFILEQLFQQPNFFDQDTIKYLLNITSEQQAQEFRDYILEHAISYSSSSFNHTMFLKDKVHLARLINKEGKNQMKNKDINPIIKNICQNLIKIFNFILQNGKLSISVHSNEINQNQIFSKIQKFIKKLKKTYPEFQDYQDGENEFTDFKEHYLKSFFVIPKDNKQFNSKVLIKSFKVPNVFQDQSATISIISALIKIQFLKKEDDQNDKIYECIYNLNGSFTIYISGKKKENNAFQMIEQAIIQIKDGEFSEDELLQAKIRSFKENNLKNAKDIFYDYFIYDQNFERKEKYNKEFILNNLRQINLTKEEIMKVADVYLYQSFQEGKYSQVIIGTQKQKITYLNSGWNIEEPIKSIQQQKNELVVQKQLYILRQQFIEQAINDMKYII